MAVFSEDGHFLLALINENYPGMISLEEAIDIAEKYLQTVSIQSRCDLMYMLDGTQEFQLGWVFFYQSKGFIETGDIYQMVGGNSPISVNKYDRSITVPGTANPIEVYIEEYLSKHSSMS